MSAAPLGATPVDAEFTTSRPIARDVARHASAVGAQVAAGAGNLVFAIVAVRLLPGGAYAHLAVFVAAYLLVNTPAASLTAGASMRPDLTTRLVPLTLRLGVLIAAVLAVAAPLLGNQLNVPASLVLLLAVDAVAAGPLAVLRGSLFGRHRMSGALLGIVSEPAVRCAVGLALIGPLGAVGAATGVVCGGYAALALCALYSHRAGLLSFGRVWHDVRHQPWRPRSPGERAELGQAILRPMPTVIAFLLFAVVTAEDVIIANRVLDPTVAGVFAAVSTLGGAVLFATATIPLIVLAPSRRTQLESSEQPLLTRRKATLTALAVTAGTSLLASGVVLSLPTSVLHVALGERTAAVRAVLPTYLAAMAVLCVARVVLAWLCSHGRGAAAAYSTGAAVLVQIVLLLHAQTASAAATATLVAGAATLIFYVGQALLVLRTLTTPNNLATSNNLATPSRPAASAESPSGSLPRATVPADVSTDPPETFAPEAAGPKHSTAERLPLLTRMRRIRMRRPQDLRWVIGCAVLGLAIRIATDRSVWIDEAISVHEASQPYGTMLQLLRDTDVHPPLYFTLLWGVIHLTGSTTEAIVRLPSLVAGVLLVVVAYYAAREFWDRRSARYAAVIMAVGPAAVWYAQDARMYALFMLFTTLAAWMVVRVLRHGRWRDVGVFALACGLMLWTQYDTLLVVLTLLAALGGAAGYRWWRDHRNRALLWRSLAASGAIVLMTLPLLPLVLHQYQHTAGVASVPSQAGQAADTASQGVNIYSALAGGTWALFGYHSDHVMLLINAFWPVLLLLVLGSLGRGRSVPVRVLALMALVPPAVLFALAQSRSDLFDLRYFSATVPALNLMLARMVASWPKGWFTRRAVPAVTAIALVAGLVDEQANSSNPRVYDFRSAVAYVRAHSEHGDLLLYGPQFLQPELEYYQPGMASAPIGPVGDTTAHPHVFLLGSFLNEKATSAAVGTTLYKLQHSRHEVAKVNFPNVTIWEFE
ncbi:MAG TPA: glycosyltransferase family 39 protein [Jatrophihabitans sp.]|jgi:O-antigen/teichoic acid export membrane protein